LISSIRKSEHFTDDHHESKCPVRKNAHFTDGKNDY
jgi:hypothetical protein